MSLRKLILCIMALSTSAFVFSAKGSSLCKTSAEITILDGEYKYDNLDHAPRDSSVIYEGDIRSFSVPSHDEMVELFKKWEKTQKKEDYDEIVNRNLRFASSIARKYKYKSRGLHLSDLIQAGNDGLERAVNKFNYRLGYKFSTYAAPWIRQMIARAIRSRGHTIYIPEGKIMARNKMRETKRKLRQNLGRDPSPEEVAQKMGITLETLKELQELPESISLETPVVSFQDVDNRLEGVLEHALEDKTITAPDAAAIGLIRSRQIRSFLSTILTPDETVVLKMYYGFEGESYAFERIAEHFDCSRTKIKNTWKRALEKLRRHPQGVHLRELLREYL